MTATFENGQIVETPPQTSGCTQAPPGGTAAAISDARQARAEPTRVYAYELKFDWFRAIVGRWLPASPSADLEAR